MPHLNTPHRQFSNTLKNKFPDENMRIRILWKQRKKVNYVYMIYITLKPKFGKNIKDVYR